MKCEEYGKIEKSYRAFLENVEGRDGLEDHDLDDLKLLNWIVKTVYVDLIHPPEDQAQWRAVLKIVMNLPVP
jgi:hypothetical protein